MSSIPILIDTDPGVDDALALFLALESPELELVAVTTVAGNVGVEATTRNALLLLELAGRADVPVHAGETPPAGGSSVTAAHVHGDDGLGGITALTDARGQPRYPLPRRGPQSLPAVDALLEYTRARPDELTLVAVGPLTNVARAAERDSDGLRRLREIVWMGGAFRCPGNITAGAEFNAFVDPDAAQTVLNLGIPMRIVPLDVTEQVVIRPEDVTQGEAHRRTALQALLEHTFAFYSDHYGFSGCHLHDPLAVAAVLWPELFRFEEAFVEVETSGEVARGMTIADLRERRERPAPNGAFAAGVDAVEARARVLARLLSADSGHRKLEEG